MELCENSLQLINRSRLLFSDKTPKSRNITFCSPVKYEVIMNHFVSDVVDVIDIDGSLRLWIVRLILKYLLTKPS